MQKVNFKPICNVFWISHCHGLEQGGKTVVDHGLVLAKGSILSQWYNHTQKFVE